MKFRTPCHEVQIGSVRASIWREENGDCTRYRVSLDRVIRPGERHARPDRFHTEDLAVISEVIDLAHLWICQQAELVSSEPSSRARRVFEPAMA